MATNNENQLHKLYKTNKTQENNLFTHYELWGSKDVKTLDPRQ